MPRKSKSKKKEKPSKHETIKRDWINAACIISFLYDVAGRAEDAYYISWDRIKRHENGMVTAFLQSGKSPSSRTCTLSPRTVKLLDQLDAGKKNLTDKIFGFNSAKSLVMNLDRKVNKLELPEGSAIKKYKWQSHNIRVSRITNMRKADYTYEKIMLVSGHKSLDSLQKYMKNDEEEMQQEMHALFV